MHHKSWVGACCIANGGIKKVEVSATDINRPGNSILVFLLVFHFVAPGSIGVELAKICELPPYSTLQKYSILDFYYRLSQ